MTWTPLVSIWLMSCIIFRWIVDELLILVGAKKD